MRMGALYVAAVTLLAACDRGEDQDDLCARAVRHLIFESRVPKDGPSQPSGAERAAMEEAVQMGIAKCRSEGLTQAQADCIFAAEGAEEIFLELPECPAIVEKQPSWVSIPPPEAREKLRESPREGSAPE